ncbi:hypothetical protein PYW08_003322 [Mythimna loreyi]|uniref:Uncharacterized protein n=1 Tax=Mythimna loreyi TaxID=667449 RepID=A0ACC2QR02_9NEOP|nr:hypothetical protein PYW08_003322 [Mythimna loreyi]
MVLSPKNVSITGIELAERTRKHFDEVVQQGDWTHNVFIYEFDASISMYHAFCAGSIISEKRVLTSAHCFVTNRKKPRRQFHLVRFVANVLSTVVKASDAGTKNGKNGTQWRKMDHVYTQKFFKFPAFNLAVATMTQPWKFNKYVTKIPYASVNMDFDGVCIATAVRATTSWATVKYLYREEVEMIQRKECEKRLYRNCRLYICSEYEHQERDVFSETEGGSLVCFDTGDPAEVDTKQGVLVAVTSVINADLPSLHMRVPQITPTNTPMGPSAGSPVPLHTRGPPESP